MSFISRIKNIIGGFALASLFATTLLAATSTPAYAHETKCPYCKLDVVQDTEKQDNEVLMRYGNKRIEYRCVLCAIAQAKTKYKGDLTILAPTNEKGKKVTIERKDGKWTQTPEAAVFVYQKGSHASCQDLYRAALNKEAAEKYIKAHDLKEAKQLSLSELVELSK